METRKKGLSARDVELLLDIPSDSDDDLVDDDDVMDPDYSGGSDSEQNVSDDECCEENCDITNEEQASTSGSWKTKAKKTEDNIKWLKGNDNLYAGNIPVFEGSPKVNVQGDMPVNYFLHLFPEDFMNDIVYQTRLYAVQKGKDNFTFTLKDLKIYLGVNIVMTYIRYSRLAHYWTTESGLRLSLIADHISSKRFKEIKRFIHLVDNSTKDPECSDRFFKIRPLFDILHKTFHESRDTEESVSIDEMMIPFKGRSCVKQYIKSKPKPWGFKIWVCAGVSGYVYCFEAYQGAKGGRDPPSKEFRATGDVVIRLCHHLDTPYHKVYADNLFTSYNLAKTLKEKNILYVGTCRINRTKGADSKLQSVKDLQKSGRGSMSIATSEDNISISRWMDNSTVHVLSSFAGLEPVKKAARYCKISKSIIDVDRPFSVDVYNRHMGGIDLMDSLVGLYRHSMRQKRWYMRIFHHFVNVALANAWILWKENGHDSLDLLEFRSSVALSLIYSGERPKKRGRPSEETELSVEVTKRKTFYARPEIRFDGAQHFPKKTESKFASKCRSKCPRKTRYMCDRCNVPLCPECFANFHSK